MGLDLIVVGHLIIEYIEFPDRVIGPVLGSPAAYTSISGKRLGMKTGIVSRIGSDMPEDLLAPFYDLEVDLSGLVQKGDSTRTTILSYDPNGCKTAFYKKVAPPIAIADIPEAYFDATAMVISPMDYEVSLSVVADLRKRCSGYLMADLGGFGGAVASSRPSSPQERLAFLESLLAYLDIVKASDEDCIEIFGSGVDPEETGMWLSSKGPKLVIITLGSEGGLIFQEDTGLLRKFPATPCEVKDITGAGDVFGAGFISEYLRSRDVERACLFGSAAASIAIERTGGASVNRMPTTEEVLSLVGLPKGR